MAIYEKGKGNSQWIEGISIGADNMVMLILNNAFIFQSSSYLSCIYNICLVILANSFLGHNVALGPVTGYFALFLHYKDSKHKIYKAVLLA